MDLQEQQPQTPLAPIATPTFGGGAVPGLPPQVSDPNAKAQQIIEMIKQAAQRKQVANTAVPAAIPAGGESLQSARSIGMNTANPHAWSTQRFLATLGANIKDGVKAQKEKQLLQAEGDWTYLQSALNELYTAQQGGDQQAVAAAQKKVDATLGDPKKLKNMAKALNQDWLNPEKTTVYGEALKKVTAKQKQQDQQNAQKQTAAQKLKETFMKVLGQKQQLQMTLDEKERMAKEIQAKAPTTTTGLDKTTASALLEQQKEEGRADAEAKKEEARAKEAEQKQAWQKEEIEMKDKLQRQRDQTQNQFHQTMETMRERSAEQRQNNHDLMMMKALGMKLDAQQEKLFKPDPTKLNKEVTDSVTSLRQQLAQANQSLRSLKTSASNHWIMGPGKDDIKSAEDDVKSFQKAIEHIEKNRDAIIHGKADLGEVMDKAYSIMGAGGEEAPPPPPVPGATVKQVQ
jgi:hypothetical protein